MHHYSNTNEFISLKLICIESLASRFGLASGKHMTSKNRIKEPERGFQVCSFAEDGKERVTKHLTARQSMQIQQHKQ